MEIRRAGAGAHGEPDLRSLALLGEDAEPLRPPDRYRIRQEEGGEAVLVCVEAPTVAVLIERGRTVTAAAARGAEKGSIFLDGAAQGPPFLDPKRAVYNLDHHEDCVRAFTLSTCEQALVLVRKIVDLRKRDWTVHANDGDLDTVLAIWVLLNHLRLNDDARLRERILPLIRLEGAIDVHGLGHLDLLALPDDKLRMARSWMDRLLEKEAELKGGDGEPDLIAYVAERLRDIDALVYPPAQLEDLAEIEEFARIPLSDGSVAIACRSDVGIYEIEDQLRRFHGDRLGMVLLQKDGIRYTLRQLDATLPADLDDVYERLNLLDPSAGGRRSSNRWGGSREIGGSPRASGTALAMSQIAEAIQTVFRPPSRRKRWARVARATWISVAALAVGLVGLAAVFLLDLNGVALAAALPPEPEICFGGVLGALAGLWLLVAGRRAPGLYGLRLPAGAGWLGLLPLAAVGALAGGSWAPVVALGPIGGEPLALALAAWLVLPATAELLFRGVILGTLAWTFPMQLPDGPWRLSAPAALSSALYAFWCALPFFADPPLLGLGIEAWPPLVPILGGLVFGVALAVARERSESILAPLVLHWLCAALVVAVPTL